MVGFATVRLVRRERSVVRCSCFRGRDSKRRNTATASREPPSVGVDRALRGPDSTCSEARRHSRAGALACPRRNMARGRRLSSDDGVRGIEPLL